MEGEVAQEPGANLKYPNRKKLKAGKDSKFKIRAAGADDLIVTISVERAAEEEEPKADSEPQTEPPADTHGIAFTSDRDGYYRIYVMNADGSNPTKLPGRAKDSQPSWSPDGAKIAFTSQRDGNSEIYVMNADGSNPDRITNDAAGARWGYDGVPSW
jgi:TolB protein